MTPTGDCPALPFTGLSLTSLLIGAAVVVAIGAVLVVVLRRKGASAVGAIFFVGVLSLAIRADATEECPPSTISGSIDSTTTSSSTTTSVAPEPVVPTTTPASTTISSIPTTTAPASTTVPTVPVTTSPPTTAPNQAPVAEFDGAEMVTTDGTVGGNLLANDTDPDGDVLTVTNPGTLAGLYGTLVVDSDGSYLYTLDPTNPDVIVVDTTGGLLVEFFDYEVGDGRGGTASGSLLIIINGPV